MMRGKASGSLVLGRGAAASQKLNAAGVPDFAEEEREDRRPIAEDIDEGGVHKFDQNGMPPR
jgi:hypothetical protein